MRKWLLNFIEIIVLIIISVTCLVLIFQNTFLKNNSIFGFRTYVIASNSMAPVLKYGDVILIKEINYDDIKVNDIITYKGISGEFKGKVITHRVIDIVYNEDTKVLKTKGEANDGIDPDVHESQVYGKLVYKFVLISLISKVVRNKIGFVLFVFIPFALIFVLEVINMTKETKRIELEKMVKKQLEELKKLNNKSKTAVSLEETICLQLDEIKKAKRDFKKIDELEYTVKIPFEDVVKEIDKLKNESNKEKEKILLEETKVLYNSDDLTKEINKEIKLKNKKVKKKLKSKNNTN